MKEKQTRLYLIDPILEKAGWDKADITREYYFTNNTITKQGDAIKRQKGSKKFADYLLSYKGFQIAIVEAKRENKSPHAGLQQAIEYARLLDVPFAYSTNGHSFIEHDFLKGTEKELKSFPSPSDLWQRYQAHYNLTDKDQELLLKPPYYDENFNKTPRYYQQIAINKAKLAIIQGQKRLLLVLATGTGKTFVAFQIIKALKDTKRVRKVLFLADRNVLIDQSLNNDFKPFKKIAYKVEKRKLDSAYEIYLSLYQQLIDKNHKKIYQTFTPNFFDLIIVDECHRSSANENKSYHEILKYFSSAIQIGLTATPKEDKEVSNQTYFGEPIYTYSLKQGIEDGFLAPYCLKRITFNIDDGYTPEVGKLDDDGEELEDSFYDLNDFDTKIHIDERIKEVAKAITNHLKETNRYDKTIIFCNTIKHAELLRMALVNENSDLIKENDKYIMKITGDDKEGKNELDTFINPKEKYPTIVTTSKLLTTGVDCKTCKNIILERSVNSMIEFKQIIGRGTRLDEKHDKFFFTIIDFRGVSEKFYDKDFDGAPLIIYDPKNPKTPPSPTPPKQGAKKIPKVSGVETYKIQESYAYYDPKKGKLSTESIIDYTKKTILNQYATLQDFKNAWESHKSKDLLEELDIKPIIDSLKKQDKFKDLDTFDILINIAYNLPPLSKAKRVSKAKAKLNSELLGYSQRAKEILSLLLDKFEQHGIDDLENIETLEIKPFIEFGSLIDIIKNDFSGTENYQKAINTLKSWLYSA
ncbi:EcoAI/FtnUII family type I restriction enzme subunit R [Helicobacter cetorum]|uniref:EcoAI/FtnUII family type I restriction enzme subunit R n=1 Tax=Helicobacter cetorum TaxID=138563 RepID=UPI000CF026C6|nr:DEAD/DEAH box helicase family protein [Helicobacter cetorum]